MIVNANGRFNKDTQSRRMFEYVDLAIARTAKGTRIVTSALVPSPWSEAVKGMFRVAQLPALVVARGRDANDITTWTGVDNIPVVLHDAEPPRTNWAAIVGLVARLAPNTLVPADPRSRAELLGWLELVAGEEGVGWNARLAMIRASHESTGGRGFPLPVAMYLGQRYGFVAGVDLRSRVGEQLALLRERLRGGPYFGGERVSALDIYVATFLTPLSVINEAACPQMSGTLHRAFASASELFADLVPDELWTHRTMMFARHLAWPIRLS
jgi:glutathione S-transferase